VGVLTDRMERPASPLRPKLRPFLVRQRVRGDVSDRQLASGVEVSLPIHDGLTGGGKDQIDRNVMDRFCGTMDRRDRPVSRVATLKRLEFHLLEGLHPETEPV